MNQVSLALNDFKKLNSLLTYLFMSKNVSREVKNEISKVAQDLSMDRTVNGFLRMASEPGMDAMASALAVKARTKILHYTEVAANAKKMSSGFSGPGLGFWPFGPSASDDRVNGLSLLQTYYDLASTFKSFSFGTFDAFLTDAEQKVPGFATSLGEIVRINNLSTSLSDADSRMKDLAQKSEGLASLSQIYSAAGGTGDTVNWSAAAPAIAVDTTEAFVETVANAAANVGTGVLDTVRLLKYLPWILGGAAGLYIYFNAGSLKTRAKAKVGEYKEKARNYINESLK